MKLFAYLLLSTFVVAGCDKKEGEPAKADGPSGAGEVYAGFDRAADLKLLAGKWSVKHEFGQPRSVWEVSGDKLKMTAGDATEELTLEIVAPGEVKAAKPDGSGRVYDYAKTADGLYIGAGGGGKKVGGTWWVRENFGVLSFDGKECVFRKENPGSRKKPFGDPQKMKCSMAEEGGKKLFKFQAPKFMKEGEFDDFAFVVVGDWLMSEQLLNDHKVEKAE